MLFSRPLRLSASRIAPCAAKLQQNLPHGLKCQLILGARDVPTASSCRVLCESSPIPPEYSGGIQAQAQPRVFFPIPKTVQTSRRQPSAIQRASCYTVKIGQTSAHCTTLLRYCQSRDPDLANATAQLLSRARRAAARRQRRWSLRFAREQLESPCRIERYSGCLHRKFASLRGQE